MDVQIVNPNWNQYGGGEKYAVSLAYALRRLGHRVNLVLQDGVTVGSLERFTGIDPLPVDSSGHFKDVDLTLFVSNWKPVYHSGDMMHILQVPYAKITPKTILKKLFINPKEAIKDFERLKLIEEARISGALVYSNFVHDTFLENYGLETTVLEPPVDSMLDPPIKKEKIILSVGRLVDGTYNNKRYDALIEAFRRLNKVHPDWKYHIAGSCPSYGYYERLERECSGLPVYFHVNQPHTQLRGLFNRASIFWHGAGLDATTPDQMEHFGISTVEAMSAGCVPFVVPNGGQKEIVSDFNNGVYWNDIDMLVAKTSYMIRVPKLRKELGIAAIERSKDYDMASFEKKVGELF